MILVRPGGSCYRATGGLIRGRCALDDCPHPDHCTGLDRLPRAHDPPGPEPAGRSDSVGDFHHRLTLLGRTNGRNRDRSSQRTGRSAQRAAFGPQGARPMTHVQRRRRDVLLAIAAVVLITLFIAAFTRSMPFILLNLVADVALVVYVFMLVQAGHAPRASRESSIRQLRVPPACTVRSRPDRRRNQRRRRAHDSFLCGRPQRADVWTTRARSPLPAKQRAKRSSSSTKRGRSRCSRRAVPSDRVAPRPCRAPR